MSDSEDDKPLAARAAPVQKSAAAANGSAAGSTGEDTTKRKAAQKAPIIDDSDSEDDQPLGARAKAAATKPAPRPSMPCWLTSGLVHVLVS